jgi:hypothetical protein
MLISASRCHRCRPTVTATAATNGSAAGAESVGTVAERVNRQDDHHAELHVLAHQHHVERPAAAATTHSEVVDPLRPADGN